MLEKKHMSNIANIMIRRHVHICLAVYHPLPSPMHRVNNQLVPRDMSDVARVSHTIVEFIWLGGFRRSSSGVCYLACVPIAALLFLDFIVGRPCTNRLSI